MTKIHMKYCVFFPHQTVMASSFKGRILKIILNQRDLNFCIHGLASKKYMALAALTPRRSNRWSMDISDNLAVKTNEPSIFLREIKQRDSVWAVCMQNNVI